MDRKLEIKDIERIAKALGDPYRLKIIEAVSKKSNWMPCCNIVDMLDLAQSTVSHHIKQLVDADLLITEKDGRQVRYELNKEVFSAYIRFLSPFKE